MALQKKKTRLELYTCPKRTIRRSGGGGGVLSFHDAGVIQNIFGITTHFCAVQNKALQCMFSELPDASARVTFVCLQALV